MNDKLLRIGQAAERLGVTVDSVRQWTNAGHLKAIRTAGGHRRYRESDVLAFRDRQWEET